MLLHPEWKDRYGKVFVSGDILRMFPQAVLLMLQNCVVLRAEAMWHREGIEYIVANQNFEPVPNGNLVPEYHADVRTLCDAEGNATGVEFLGWHK